MSDRPQLFEVAWEVCNKVGGIHTVLSTKCRQALEEFPDSYTTVGPYLGNTQEFREDTLPVSLKGISTSLAKKGITLHYGTWLIPGEPRAILLDPQGLGEHLNEYKATWWDSFQLDSLSSSYDTDQPLLWSLAVGHLIEEYAAVHPEQILVHAHEWLSAGCLLHLAQTGLPQVKTIFTTHATVLGRTLASQDNYHAEAFATLDPGEAARTSGVWVKHQLESLAAKVATRFTTVSEITATEATVFLGRPVDAILENGISPTAFPTFDQSCVIRLNSRARLEDFLSAYFFPHSRFDLDQTFYCFSMGRQEVHNKGYDRYLEALGLLNKRLKQEDSSETVVAFLMTPGATQGVLPTVSDQLIAYQRITSLLRDISKQKLAALYDTLWQSPDTKLAPEVPELLRVELQQLLRHLPQTPPPVSPYVLPEGDEHPILQLAQRFGLHNTAKDKVKLVFFPVYLNGFDGIFNLSLYELISGFDLGVFPSLYEPWGYTPMESLALGIPAIVSPASGFGQSVAIRHCTGVFSLKDLSDSAKQIEEFLNKARLEARQASRKWLLRRIDAYKVVQPYSWEELYARYRQLYHSLLTS